MDNGVRFYMLRGVQQCADCEYRCLISASKIIHDEIKEKNEAFKVCKLKTDNPVKGDPLTGLFVFTIDNKIKI